MKTTNSTILTSIGLCIATVSAFLIVSGCAGTPTKFEQKVFDIQTNYVPVLVFQTNTVTLTNQVVTMVFQTNSVGVVKEVMVTNMVSFPTYNLVTVTNLIPQYEFKNPSAAAQAAQTTGGVIGNLAAPGVGGPIASGIIGLVLAGWQWFRSSKSTKTSINSAQVIEVMRELLKTMPNGAQYDSILTQWMQQHQADAGVLNNVLTILENNVSNNDAKSVVAQLQSALAALQTTPATPTPAKA